MTTLLDGNHTALATALCNVDFRQSFVADPRAALDSIGLSSSPHETVERALCYLSDAAREALYVEQLLITSCDSDYEATTGRETNASDRDC